MLDLQVLRIRQVLDVEIILHPLHAVCRQVDDLILLIDDKLAGLLDLLAHDGVHLAELTAGLAALHGLRQCVTDLVKLGGFAALSGDNQRGTGLVDQNGVNLVDDGVMQVSLYQLLLVDNHVITQVIKAQLIVGYISNITVISGTPLISCAAVQNHADGQSQSLMYLAHPGRVTMGQIIVDRNDMDALTLQCVQVSRKGGHQGLSFTCLHLGDTSLMQDNTTNQLYPVMLHTKHTLRSLADSREGLYQQIIQGLAIGQTLLEFFCLSLQFFIRKLLHLRAERFDPIHQRVNQLQLPFTVSTKHFCK